MRRVGQTARMAYAMVEIDVSRPLPDLDLDGAADGVGLLLRDGGRPAGFLLLPRPAGLTAPQLERLAVATAGEGLLAERLRRDLLRHDAAVHGTEGTGGDGTDEPAHDLGRVTVAVCTRDRPDDLRLCLDSLERARSGWPGEVELLVVDNAPPDDRTEQVVRSRPGVRYVREPLAGLDVARNRALENASGTWLAFVDDDVRVDPGWLAGLAAARSEHPDAAGVVGLVLPAQLETPAQVRFEQRGGFGRGFAQRRWDGRHGPGGRLHPLGAGVFGAGCDMAFEVAALRALGGFDEALDTGAPLPGGGDLDIFFRVLDAGHVLVYEPRMAVFHRHRRGMDELRRQYSSWGAGFVAYLGARWARPADRAQITRMVVWWLGYQRRQLRAGVRAADPVDVRMALAELTGFLAGAGGYTRSQQRMAARRAALAGVAVGGPTS